MTFTVFGYGSLVNRGTLPDFVAAEAGVLSGWRRAWRAASRTPVGGACAVSIVEADGAIDGLYLTFEDAMRPVLEAREHRYGVVDIPGGQTFRALPEIDRFGDRDHPIHLSYVDTVLQGFLVEFGTAGVERFMATTDGWYVPIVDDRNAPRYPRAQHLKKSERALVDDALAAVDATIFSTEDIRV